MRRARFHTLPKQVRVRILNTSSQLLTQYGNHKSGFSFNVMYICCQANDAVRQAKDAATILDTKHESAEEVRYRIQHAGQAASAANNEAQMAYDKANQARNMSMSEVTRVTEVQRSIDEFQRSGPPTPEDVKALAEEVRFNTD